VAVFPVLVLFVVTEPENNTKGTTERYCFHIDLAIGAQLDSALFQRYIQKSRQLYYSPLH